MVTLDAQDVATGGAHEGEQTLRDRLLQFPEVACLGRDLAELDQLALRADTLLEIVEQRGLGEGAGHQLADVAGEVEVLGVVALAHVFQLDETHGAALDEQRYAERAPCAPLLVVGDFRGCQAGVLETGDHQRLAGLQRLAR